MNKMVSFDGIGYVAATYPVNDATISYLKTNHTNPKTGNVDINGKKLAVKLDAEGKIGFGAATPTTADALLGIIMAYEMDGFASVQTEGYIDEVPTKEAITGGKKSLAVNDKGQVVETADSSEVFVNLPAKSDNLYVSIKL